MKMALIINKNAINSICSMCFIFLMNAYLFKCQTNTFLMETNLGKFLQNITSKKYESKSTHSEYRKLDKNAVIAAFEGFRQIIDDPMVVSEQPMSHNIADIIRTEGYIKNISVFHLRNATLNRVFIADDDSYGEVEITFPVLRVAGSYNMTFWLDRHNISMYGNGSFAFELENLKVALNMTFEKTSQGYGELNKIGWNQTLEGVKIDITNLLDDAEVSSMFSENLSVIIPSLHRTYKPTIDEFMSHAVTVYWKVLFLKNNLSNLNNAVASNGISSLQTLVRALANEAENIRKDYSLAP